MLAKLNRIELILHVLVRSRRLQIQKLFHARLRPIFCTYWLLTNRKPMSADAKIVFIVRFVSRQTLPALRQFFPAEEFLLSRLSPINPLQVEIPHVVVA